MYTETQKTVLLNKLWGLSISHTKKGDNHENITENVRFLCKKYEQ